MGDGNNQSAASGSSSSRASGPGGSTPCSTTAASAWRRVWPWSWPFPWPFSSTSSSSRSTTWPVPRPWSCANSVRKPRTPPPRTSKTRSSGRTSACCSASRRRAPTRSTATSWIPVMRQGLAESPFVEAFYVWSAVAAHDREKMLVYNRDSLAEDSADLERRFRDAPGVGADDPAAAGATARAQARHRRLPRHHRRPAQVRAGPAPLPQPRALHHLEFHRAGGRRRRDAHRAPAGADEGAAGQGAAPGRLPAARSHASRRHWQRRLHVGARAPGGVRRRAQLPAGLLRPRAARVRRAVRSRARNLDACRPASGIAPSRRSPTPAAARSWR